MKRKICALLLLGSCLISISACGDKAASDHTANVSDSSQEETSESKDTEESKDPEGSKDTEESANNTGDESEKQIKLDELSDVISTDVENTLSSLNTEYEKLITEIDTYEKYLENTDRVKAFFDQVCEDTQQLFSRMREYSNDYVKEFLPPDESNTDQYEELYNYIYRDAWNDIDSGIRQGIVEDMYNVFRSNVFADNEEEVWDEWYGWWLEAYQSVYEECTSFHTDIFILWFEG